MLDDAFEGASGVSEWFGTTLMFLSIANLTSGQDALLRHALAPTSFILTRLILKTVGAVVCASTADVFLVCVFVLEPNAGRILAWRPSYCLLP